VLWCCFSRAATTLRFGGCEIEVNRHVGARRLLRRRGDRGLSLQGAGRARSRAGARGRTGLEGHAGRRARTARRVLAELGSRAKIARTFDRSAHGQGGGAGTGRLAPTAAAAASARVGARG